MKIDRVLIKPVVTEKATGLASAKVYVFETSLDSNKYQIKNVLEKLYKVKVGEIKIMVRKGKTRKTGRKMVAKKLRDRKFAFIKLIEGKIDLFPQG